MVRYNIKKSANGKFYIEAQDMERAYGGYAAKRGCRPFILTEQFEDYSFGVMYFDSSEDAKAWIEAQYKNTLELPWNFST